MFVSPEGSLVFSTGNVGERGLMRSMRGTFLYSPEAIGQAAHLLFRRELDTTIANESTLTQMREAAEAEHIRSLLRDGVLSTDTPHGLLEVVATATEGGATVVFPGEFAAAALVAAMHCLENLNEENAAPKAPEVKDLEPEIRALIAAYDASTPPDEKMEHIIDQHAHDIHLEITARETFNKIVEYYNVA